MTSDATAGILRDHILSRPDMVLDDPDVMRALVTADDASRGGNVVDLRGIAMERLEARLSRLEDTHRSVIAAAYDNLTGTNQVHRACLAFLEPASFPEFLAALSGDVAQILRVSAVRLVIEAEEDAHLDDPSGVLTLAPPGFVDRYAGRAGRVTLRETAGSETIFGAAAGEVRSEALLPLDLGSGRHPGLLAFASPDPAHFNASQGTDLLTFMAGVFERALRRWLD